MVEITVLFNDTPKLDQTMREASAYDREGVSWHLIYAGVTRPPRLKRWVSHSGWERLSAERARKMAQPVVDRLAGRVGSRVQLVAARGDPLSFAQDYLREFGLQHLIDARSAHDLSVQHSTGRLSRA